ncbi:SDR family NAD(P)-dependent oxidoreductase [Cryobacterium sp. TMT1-21]|uniref:SDR family NAD(P)-dependent oxidoreductase n=1 Tax=Cryobacterium shii TaxID=1259235 RepID=A0AAQ2C411_9MICO|nr:MULTISPECIES: SDR family NAD(P)-dependent oxidoreductase [Cryobacterium]TFC42495.1 SDR family NAD(P)-dependent oxidoreductase [Cryobacterium shii]TFC80827.1 SDR family NAD(P)-dependent oxidoreductase [Cryobacterium sp. TmT2-59]TFD13245.1 SDR family NAD(P)-dependent oxidoreductase [Cryobacterium sp. TMT1-21]TFD18666.1 SDR family NAD(P)-dependent oxidoreductase [Cryobacterium sp. TMT4-10]TFD28468.1 SDR family NAD(P)-dependent oxidoreductase [Cryobacterium sp. TMT2-23]
MTARTILITGASDGIGTAAARALGRDGDRVVIVGRSPAKTAAVAAELGADFFVADFARLDEVRTLAAQLLERYPRIDVLANNAGGIMGNRETTVDGYELTFQVNHLAPFLLTTLLMERLVASQARVINTSSAANLLFGKIDLDDLQAETKYSANKAYGDGKLANILFTRELHHRFHDQGISTAAFHPGVVATSFSTGSTTLMRLIYRTPLKRLLLGAEQGADTLVWLATAKPGTDWVSGEYYEKRVIQKANKQAYDPALAAALWEQSAALVTGHAAPLPG